MATRANELRIKIQSSECRICEIKIETLKKLPRGLHAPSLVKNSKSGMIINVHQMFFFQFEIPEIGFQRKIFTYERSAEIFH